MRLPPPTGRSKPGLLMRLIVWLRRTRYAAHLASGGQRTRVGLAALIFGEPDFLIRMSR